MTRLNLRHNITPRSKCTAFPANEKFNAAQRDKIDVPLFFGAGEHSPFAKLLPKVAADLRAHGWTDVQTGLVPGGVHYLVEDHPNALAELIEKPVSGKNH